MKAYLYTDGASRGNPGPAGIGILLTDEQGQVLLQHSEPIGQATNNVAEYRALIRGLELAARRGVTHLIWLTDSELLMRQWRGDYTVRAKHLQRLFLKARRLAAQFTHLEVCLIPRRQNRIADTLARQAIKE